MDADIKGMSFSGKEINIPAGTESEELSIDACKFVKAVFSTVQIIEGKVEMTDTDLFKAKKKEETKAKRVANMAKARAARKSVKK